MVPDMPTIPGMDMVPEQTQQNAGFQRAMRMMKTTQKGMARTDSAYWSGYFARHENYPAKLLNEAVEAVYH